MKKKLVIIFIILIAIVTIHIAPDIIRMAFGLEGRYSDIRKMKKVFRGGQVKDNMDSFKHYYDDSSWVHVLATDSHHGGGTIGVLESSGIQHFYFGHVCGFGEGIFISVRGDHFDPNQEGKIK